MTGKIAYMMSRFPHLPETFILREMDALRDAGWDVHLFPLILQSQDTVHPEAQTWVQRAYRQPFISPALLANVIRQYANAPRHYTDIMRTIISENRANPNFLLRALAIVPKVIRFAQEMEARSIQHIHAHYATHPALAAWIIHHLTGIPYSVTVHAHDIFVEQDMLVTKMRDAEFIVAISQFNVDFLVNHCGTWITEKTHIVHCGITPDAYQPPALRERAALTIVSIGSLQPYKGQQYLIDAIRLLRDRGVPVSCQIIGGGGLADALQARINHHGLQAFVELAGAKTQQEVAIALKDANCYVQPSIITPSGKMEGIPVALMEAMASELPVVASALSGIPELVQPGKTGWLVPPADPDAIADAVQMIFENPITAMVTARAGRQHVLSEFNLQANVAQLARLFDDIIPIDQLTAQSNPVVQV